MDLTDYAGVFILVIIVGTVLLMLAANRMGKHASSIFLVASIGVFAGLLLINLCDFKDASLEAVITIMVSAWLPASIIVCRWAFQFWSEIRERKIQVLKATIIDDFELRKRKLYIEKEILEKELIINNSMHNLLRLLQSCVSTELNFYENHEMRKYKEKRKEMLRTIDNREKELNIIDSWIEDVRIDNRYSRLLRIKRGDMK